MRFAPKKGKDQGPAEAIDACAIMRYDASPQPSRSALYFGERLK
jgi:hypothetical protein